MPEFIEISQFVKYTLNPFILQNEEITEVVRLARMNGKSIRFSFGNIG
jgi:hypothetical protein